MQPSYLKFTQALMLWNSTTNNRTMPWKGEKDAYRIWLSEIILQQTRVEQGLDYYQKFVLQYPTVHHLAQATNDQVFKLWEGLGYYNRCRNLLHTAKEIVAHYNGQFPNEYTQLLALKGIGSYTAAAIASFAFELPFAVVDGNVLRVIARVFGLSTPIDTTTGKKFFTNIANDLLDKKKPAAYNQAIMDFGATVCKPLAPCCIQCPLQKECKSYAMGTPHLFPVKEKKLKRTVRYFSYFILVHNKKVWVRKREEKDIWQSLFEFYLTETNRSVQWNEKKVQVWAREHLQINAINAIAITPTIEQKLTHQTIRGQFVTVDLQIMPQILQPHSWVPISKLKLLTFPKFIHQYFEYQKINGL